MEFRYIYDKFPKSVVIDGIKPQGVAQTQLLHGNRWKRALSILCAMWPRYFDIEIEMLHHERNWVSSSINYEW